MDARTPAVIHGALFFLGVVLGICAVASPISTITSLVHSQLAGAATTQTNTLTEDGKKYQYVLFSFDGSRDVHDWDRTISFARSMRDKGFPFHFTYFINAIYLLPTDHRTAYHPPRAEVGASMIGWGGSVSEISDRITRINTAYADGNEIACHTVGHFSGKNWTKADWDAELTQFDTILDGARAGAYTNEKLTVPKAAITGFRAPFLAYDDALFSALTAHGYQYDSSIPLSLTDARMHFVDGLLEIPLAYVPYKHSTSIAMDFNLFVHDSNTKSTLKKGTKGWNDVYEALTESYKGYFEHEYAHAREPVKIAYHFESWNDDVYWEALKAFAEEVCIKPDVRCSTYTEAATYTQNTQI